MFDQSIWTKIHPPEPSMFQCQIHSISRRRIFREFDDSVSANTFYESGAFVWFRVKLGIYASKRRSKPKIWYNFR